MAFEEEFGIEIPDEDAEKMETVGDAIKYLEERKGPSSRMASTDEGLSSRVWPDHSDSNDVSSNWEALLAGKSGGATITLFDPSDQPVRFAAEVKDFDPTCTSTARRLSGQTALPTSRWPQRHRRGKRPDSAPISQHRSRAIRRDYRQRHRWHHDARAATPHLLERVPSVCHRSSYPCSSRTWRLGSSR